MNSVDAIGDSQCSVERAQDLTEKIRTSLSVAWELVKEAYTERAWAALGYSSWDDYCSEEFGSNRVRLPREERREVVGSLREAGLSIRAIASATGQSKNTVKGDLRQVGQIDPPDPEPITGTDGKTYTPPTPKPQPTKPQRRALTDSFFDAMFDLSKRIESVQRLTEDDRFPRNAEQIAARHRSDLLVAAEAIQDILGRLPDTH